MSGLRAGVAQRAATVGGRFSGSAAGHLWRQLNAMDFINRGMLFAAVLLLCFVPFIIIVQALAGRSAATTVIRRFGLTPEAAGAMSQVLTSPSATFSATIV